MVEPLVMPFVVVVRDELTDGATQRALADQDHALEAGVLDGAHEALRVGVQVRRAGGASEGGDIGRGERVAPGRPEARVAVMDEDPSVSQESVSAAVAFRMSWGTPGPSGSALMPAICGVGAWMRAGLRASNRRARHLPMRYETGLPSSVIRFRT